MINYAICSCVFVSLFNKLLNNNKINVCSTASTRGNCLAAVYASLVCLFFISHTHTHTQWTALAIVCHKCIASNRKNTDCSPKAIYKETSSYENCIIYNKSDWQHRWHSLPYRTDYAHTNSDTYPRPSRLEVIFKPNSLVDTHSSNVKAQCTSCWGPS